ncbi:transposase [Anaerotignum propionicum]|uniref:transposase n=1 Tax=Anaerotignum propionicum TaxID=28446 RepID=UPI003BEED9B2
MVLIPSGGLTTLGKWQPSRKKFFLPVRVLSRKFRGKFLALLKLQIPEIEQNLLDMCYQKNGLFIVNHRLKMPLVLLIILAVILTG